MIKSDQILPKDQDHMLDLDLAAKVNGEGLQTLRDKKLRRKGKVCKLPI